MHEQQQAIPPTPDAARASASAAGMERWRTLLREYWGYDDFRGIQADIIRSIAAGNDTLGLMPTGGGKSITFQVPALAAEGMTIVVTPLIALMKDQVENLCRRGIRAAAVYSGMDRSEILRHLDNSVLGAYKLLYVSPERLGTDIFQNKLRRMKVAFLTVDEAHCISQWGYDFRPAYLEISRIRKLLPGIPVLALTATATPQVAADICERLCFDRQRRQVFRMSFGRDNLRYIVRHTHDKDSELLHILRSVAGSAVVYTRNRQRTTEVARLLLQEGISALNYHAGLSDIDKDVRQRSWQEGACRVMVATNAFGMGIDKADVRLVVHMDLPDSVEAYFQEAGRAGRDGQTAYAVLLYNKSDRGKMMRRIPETFPDKAYVSDVYDKLAYFFQLAVGDGYQVTREFNLEKFCRNFRLFPVPAASALALLSRAGYIDYREEEESTSRLLIIVGRESLYDLHRLPPHCDDVLRAALRRYGGLFSDYVYVDEATLAADCGIGQNEVYEALKNLTHLRIVHYIPRKRTPYVTYLTRRVGIGEVYLPPEVYDVRKACYRERVEAMTAYAAGDTVCRSRYLLAYFGEEAKADCGHCDVCLARRKAAASADKLAAEILQTLADGRPHMPEELKADGYSESVREETFRRLVREGRIVLRDGHYVLG